MTRTPAEWRADFRNTLTTLTSAASGVAQYVAMFAAGVTFAEARADLVDTSSLKNGSIKSPNLNLFFGSFLCHKFEGLDAADALVFSAKAQAVFNKDVDLMLKSLDDYTNAKDVVVGIETLTARIPQKVVVQQTPEGKFESEVATATAALKAEGFTLDQALPKAVAAVKAQFATKA
jgi:hypothetical protein